MLLLPFQSEYLRVLVDVKLEAVSGRESNGSMVSGLGLKAALHLAGSRDWTRCGMRRI